MSTPAAGATGGSNAGSGAQTAAADEEMARAASATGGASSAGTGGSASGGSLGSGGAAAGTGGAGGSASCTVMLSVLAPQMENSLFPGKNSRVRVKAVLPITDNLPVWTIKFLDVTPPQDGRIPPDVVNDTPGISIADFATVDAGNYLVTVSAGVGVPCRDATLPLLVQAPLHASFQGARHSAPGHGPGDFRRRIRC